MSEDDERIEAIRTIQRDLVPPQTSAKWFAEIVMVHDQPDQAFLMIVDSVSAWVFTAELVNLEELSRDFEQILNGLSAQTLLPSVIATKNKDPFYMNGVSVLQKMFDNFGLQHIACTRKEEEWLDSIVLPFQKDLESISSGSNPIGQLLSRLDQGFKEKYGVYLKDAGKATREQTLLKAAGDAEVFTELLGAWMKNPKGMRDGLEIARKAIRSTLQLLLVNENAAVSADTVIKDWIYNEDGEMAVANLVQRVVATFENEDEKIINLVTQILSKAWNAFPHRRLQDRCPFEAKERLWFQESNQRHR